MNVRKTLRLLQAATPVLAGTTRLRSRMICCRFPAQNAGNAGLPTRFFGPDSFKS
jgi:hypothetical protein